MGSIPLVERNRVDLKQVAKFSIPFYFLILFIIIIVISENVMRGVDLFFFTMISCIILTPFFFPIMNFVFFQHLRLYHKFILTIMGLKGDSLSLYICFYIAIIYTVISYIVLCATIISILLEDYEIEIRKKYTRTALIIISKISLKKIKNLK